MEIYSIATGNFKLDGGAMFGVVPKILWQKAYPADENNQCNWAMRCMLVITDDKKILIDTGIGTKQDEKFRNMYHLNGEDTLFNSLQKHNTHPEDITDVILTHLHFDHVGGAVKYNDDKSKLQLTFSNANYWVSRTHWEMAVNPNRKEKPSFLKENILPIQVSGHLKFIENDCQLFPEIYVKLFHGHTVGQVLPYISYKGTQIVYMADLMPATAHIPIAYVMGYDSNPLDTLKEKEIFLTEAVEKGHILFFEHDINIECCTVHSTEKGIKVKETFTLQEALNQIY